MTDHTPARPAFDPADLPTAAAAVRRAREGLQRLGDRPGPADELKAVLTAAEAELARAARPELAGVRVRERVYALAAGVLRVGELGPGDWWAAPFALGLAGAVVAIGPALLVKPGAATRAAVITVGYVATAAAVAAVLAPVRAVGPEAAADRLAEARAARRRVATGVRAAVRAAPGEREGPWRRPVRGVPGRHLPRPRVPGGGHPG